jgi:acetate kinase
MRILVVNAGSSSLKLNLLDGADVLEQSVNVPAGDAPLDTDALSETVRAWAPPDVVAHRIVHGGDVFTRATRIEGSVRDQLQELTDLAPLHQPKSLAGLDAVSALLPAIPAVACFDTSFHTSIPAAASTYAVPEEWRRRWAIKRYGFHGLSHAYAARRASEIVGRPLEELRIVTCHLGAGASLCAVVGGRSVDTTMGFTPLEGLVMATRSGSVDPGLVLWLEEHEHLTPHQVAQALEHRSGLTALAGTGDMREIQSRADSGDDNAKLALDVFIHSLAGHVSAMTASTAGLDVLVFTGGVGQNSAIVRRLAAERLGYLGVEIDDELNANDPVDVDVAETGAAVRTVVVAAREDLQMARETRQLIGAG